MGLPEAEAVWLRVRRLYVRCAALSFMAKTETAVSRGPGWEQVSRSGAARVPKIGGGEGWSIEESVVGAEV